MRILILNWRSIKDPLAGGAELATFEHAKRWVKNHKAQVTWLSPKYDETVSEEVIDGIDFVYIAKPLTRSTVSLFFRFPYFYISVFFHYLTKYRGKIDLVIDQVHGLPYLTPLYVKEPIFVHVNEIAGEIWDKMYKFPINKIGRLLEKIIFKPYIWRNSTFIAISQSTKKDILALGVKEKNIKIVYCGVSMEILEEPPIKEEVFTIIFLNRLVKMKGIELAIDLMGEIKNKLPQFQFWIVGRGEDTYVNYLKQKVNALGLTNETTFFGFVDQPKKVELLTRANVLINTSYKEGWGLVNIEANCRGTPVIAFKVHGNSDSVLQNVSGMLIEEGSAVEMEEALLEMLKEESMQSSSIKFARQFDWNVVSEEYFNQLQLVRN